MLPQNIPSVYLTATYNYDPMSVDNTYDEEQVVTKSLVDTDKPSPSDEVSIFVTRAPIDSEKPPFQTVDDTLSSSSSTPINTSTYSLPFSAGVTVVLKIAPMYMENPPFQPSTITLYHSAVVPADLSFISAPSKPPQR